MTKQEVKEKKTKSILVRVLPSVYDECLQYNLNIPMIMRRGLIAELELHKMALGKRGTTTTRLMWQDYDDKTMTFINKDEYKKMCKDDKFTQIARGD